MMGSAIVLASASAIRRELLVNAGFDVEVHPAEVDEDAIKSAVQSGSEPLSPTDVALILAQTKAQTVSEQRHGQFVIGADQILSFDGQIFSKPSDKQAARDQLIKLRGKSHELISAVAVAADGQIVWSDERSAVLHMREFSNEFLGRYLAAAGNSVLETVGGYKLEGRGVQFFDRIVGDYFTVLGLPMLPLLAFLRAQMSDLV